MMGQSLQMFDAMLAMDAMTPVVVPRQNLKTPKEQHALQAAEQTLDDLVASFFSKMEDPEEKEMAAHRLEARSDNYLLTHRRLSEGDSTPRSKAEAHLARRLTEYSFEVFSTPNTVTLFYSPVLEMGQDGNYLDTTCLYSQYHNGDLGPDCKVALDMLELGRHTSGLMFDEVYEQVYPEKRALDSPLSGVARTIQTAADSMEQYRKILSILVGVYALIAIVGICIGLIDVWTFVASLLISGMVATWGFCILMFVLPTLLLVDCLFCGNDDEEEEEMDEDVDVHYEYVKLSDDDEGGDSGTIKQAETLVFVGVPVQVV